MVHAFLKDIIIGHGTYIKSWSTHRRAMLTGMTALLVLSISIFHLLFDAFHNSYKPFIVYFLFNFGALVSFALNRYGRYDLAKYILLLIINFTAYLIASSEGHKTGVYLYFIPNSMIAFALFSYEERIKGVYFTFLSIFLFLVLVLSGYSILPKVEYSHEYAKLSFLTNFLLSLLASVIMLMFLIIINNKSETELKNNQYNLLTLTSELRKSRSRFELAIRGSSAGIWDWNVKESTIYCSPQLKDMLGYTSEDLNNVTFNTFIKSVHEEDKARVKNAIIKHLNYRAPFEEEFRMVTGRGDIKWVLDSGQAEWDEHGKALRMVGTLVDITERKDAEYKVNKQNHMLAKANDELDRFVYSTSHDLRAPLMSVLGLINIAKKSDDRSEVFQCLELMHERVKNLDDFIQEIIDFSRNSRTEVEMKSIHLAPMVHEIIENLKYMDEFSRINTIIDIQSDFVLKSDPSRLKVILNNLISNSIKYYDRDKNNPFIKISVKKNEYDVQLRIEDNGEGILEDKLNKIFEMFFRASEKSKGSGLGLYIVKEMLDRLKGTIRVQSAEGEGALFIINLPGAVENA